MTMRSRRCLDARGVSKRLPASSWRRRSTRAAPTTSPPSWYGSSSHDGHNGSCPSCLEISSKPLEDVAEQLNVALRQMDVQRAAAGFVERLEIPECLRHLQHPKRKRLAR